MCGPNRSNRAGPRSGSVCLPSDWPIRRGGWTPRAGCSVELRPSTLLWRLPSGRGFPCWCIAFRSFGGCRTSFTDGWRITAIASRARLRTANHIRNGADRVRSRRVVRKEEPDQPAIDGSHNPRREVAVSLFAPNPRAWMGFEQCQGELRASIRMVPVGWPGGVEFDLAQVLGADESVLLRTHQPERGAVISGQRLSFHVVGQQDVGGQSRPRS